MLVGICLRKFDKQRPQHRQSGARHLFHSAIEVRHQFIALFDVAAANSFLLGSVHPRFAMRSTFFTVIAINRLKGCYFRPFGEELGRRSTDEAGDVGTAHSKAAETKIFQHGSREPQMIPSGAVVTSPRRRVTLSSGIGGARQYKWTLLRRNHY